MSVHVLRKGGATTMTESQLTAERLTRDTAVIHVNLAADDTVRAIEKHLDRVGAYADGLCGRNPELDHLAIVLSDCRVPRHRVVRLARRFALSLHQRLEMEVGTDVAVTAVVNVPPLASEVLHERLVALARCAIGVDPAVAVTTEEIAARDINDVSVTEIV